MFFFISDLYTVSDESIISSAFSHILDCDLSVNLYSGLIPFIIFMLHLFPIVPHLCLFTS